MYLKYRGKPIIKKVLIIKWKQTRKKKGLNQHQPKSTYEAKQIKISINDHIVNATATTLSYPTNHYGALQRTVRPESVEPKAGASMCHKEKAKS